MSRLLINILNIYEKFILIINGEKINNTRVLPQGSALSPIFLFIYKWYFKRVK